MTTGTLSGGMCFSSQAAAARNECSLSVKSGSNSLTCNGLTGTLPSETVGGSITVTLSQRWQAANSNSFTTVSYPVTLQACELEDYWPMPMTVENGIAIAVAVASCWLAAYAWRSVRRSMAGE